VSLVNFLNWTGKSTLLNHLSGTNFREMDALEEAKWLHYIGREQAANRPLLRIVFLARNAISICTFRRKKKKKKKRRRSKKYLLSLQRPRPRAVAAHGSPVRRRLLPPLM
ncbi:hypothetical protein GW17_00008165, partial [Ensete ventricosum]